MSDTENISVPKGKKRRKRFHFGFVYLFLFVFMSALAGISYLVKSYSPDIDVEIGKNESLMLNESEAEVEIKSIDERLKWIQMEDELPTVALRSAEEKKAKSKELTFEEKEDKTLKEDSKAEKEDSEKESQKESKKEDKKEQKTPPVPTVEDIKKAHSDFREIPAATPVVPEPSPTITKVYLGKYSTIEEAMQVQNEVAASESSVTPFVKSVNNEYIVQLGSFSEKDRAKALIEKMRSKGYSPKIKYEH
ncbi:SPOR domain-containing protein [bacterium]|nr:SPOR domain-containing protein [bacterium]